MEFSGASKVGQDADTAGAVASAKSDADRRIYVRFAFRGTPFPIRLGELESVLRLKDLSCGGASALTELPLKVGDVVYVELDKKHVVAADVRWVRRLSVGISFVTPLSPMLVRRVHADWSKRASPFGR